LECTQNADGHALWTAESIKLHSLHKVLNWYILPDDFNFPEFEGERDAKFVKETYVYVIENINLNLPLHHLALILGIIFSKLCPNVFTEATALIFSSPQLTSSPDSAHQFLNKIPWSSHQAAEKKGNTH
jgi:hypothetical protein